MSYSPVVSQEPQFEVRDRQRGEHQSAQFLERSSFPDSIEITEMELTRESTFVYSPVLNEKNYVQPSNPGDGTKDMVESNSVEIDEKIPAATLPNMYSFDYIGLYCQFAAVGSTWPRTLYRFVDICFLAGLLYGSCGSLNSFCTNVFKGPSNVCSNSTSIVICGWSFKVQM